MPTCIAHWDSNGGRKSIYFLADKIVNTQKSLLETFREDVSSTTSLVNPFSAPPVQNDPLGWVKTRFVDLL